MTILVSDRDMRTLERGRNGYERCQRGGYRNAIFNSVKDRALDGQIVKFDTPFWYKNGLIMIEPDAFGDVEDYPVSFCIDHELETAVASTDDGLTLIVDDDGVQFRLDLEQAKRVGDREAMSLGCDILEECTKNIAGHDVRVVSRARLREVSVCRNGAAGDNAFAFLVDTTVTPKPVAGSRSKKFRDYNAMYKVSRKVREVKATNTALLALQERLALLGSESAPWTMTLDQSNRLETDRNDAMRSDRRARM